MAPHTRSRGHRGAFAFATASLCLFAACYTATNGGGGQEAPSDVAAPNEGGAIGAEPNAASTSHDGGKLKLPCMAVSSANAGTDGGIDAAEDADSGALQCNDLAQVGAPVDALSVKGSSSYSTFNGGTIVDGTYVLTKVIDYISTPGFDGGTKPFGAETIRIKGGTIEEVFVRPDGHLLRFTAQMTTAGARLQLAPSCGSLAHWLEFQFASRMTSYDATPETLTVWAPVGNHSSYIHVFSKICD